MEDPPIKSPVPLEEQKNCGGSATEMRGRDLRALALLMAVIKLKQGASLRRMHGRLAARNERPRIAPRPIV
jgi:hypothetical protein